MNKFIKTFILGLIIFVGIGIFANSAKAEGNFTLELISPPWDVIYGGETKTTELKIINNTGSLLEGEATFSGWYEGEPFKGNLIAINPSFGLSNNHSEWIEGSVMFSDFEISKGQTFTNLKIKTHPALMPGQYSFIFTIRGITGEKEYITPPVVIGGGGDFIVSDLTIDDERVRVVETGEDFAVIAWNTNLPAFGRVIYDTRPHQFNFIEGEPAYGYAFYTPKTEKQDTFHLITLTGLNPGAIYYYRVVSYGSLAISREYSFITKGVKGWTIEEEEKAAEEKERIIEGVAPSVPVDETEEPSIPEEVDLPEKEVVLDKEKAPQKGLASMLASIGMIWGDISQSTLKTIFVILLLAILTLIIVKEGQRQFQKKRNK